MIKRTLTVTEEIGQIIGSLAYEQVGERDRIIVKIKGREALHFRSSRGLVLSGLLFIAITLIATCLTIWDLREDRIADEMRDAQGLGVILAEQTARTIQAVDLVIY